MKTIPRFATQSEAQLQKEMDANRLKYSALQANRLNKNLMRQYTLEKTAFQNFENPAKTNIFSSFFSQVINLITFQNFSKPTYIHKEMVPLNGISEQMEEIFDNNSSQSQSNNSVYHLQNDSSSNNNKQRTSNSNSNNSNSQQTRFYQNNSLEAARNDNQYNVQSTNNMSGGSGQSKQQAQHAGRGNFNMHDNQKKFQKTSSFTLENNQWGYEKRTSIQERVSFKQLPVQVVEYHQKLYTKNSPKKSTIKEYFPNKSNQPANQSILKVPIPLRLREEESEQLVKIRSPPTFNNNNINNRNNIFNNSNYIQDFNNDKNRVKSRKSNEFSIMSGIVNPRQISKPNTLNREEIHKKNMQMGAQGQLSMTKKQSLISYSIFFSLFLGTIPYQIRKVEVPTIQKRIGPSIINLNQINEESESQMFSDIHHNPPSLNESNQSLQEILEPMDNDKNDGRRQYDISNNRDQAFTSEDFYNEEEEEKNYLKSDTDQKSLPRASTHHMLMLMKNLSQKPILNEILTTINQKYQNQQQEILKLLQGDVQKIENNKKEENKNEDTNNQKIQIEPLKNINLFQTNNQTTQEANQHTSNTNNKQLVNEDPSLIMKYGDFDQNDQSKDQPQSLLRANSVLRNFKKENDQTDDSNQTNHNIFSNTDVSKNKETTNDQPVPTTNLFNNQGSDLFSNQIITQTNKVEEKPVVSLFNNGTATVNQTQPVMSLFSDQSQKDDLFSKSSTEKPLIKSSETPQINIFIPKNTVQIENQAQQSQQSLQKTEQENNKEINGQVNLSEMSFSINPNDQQNSKQKDLILSPEKEKKEVKSEAPMNLFSNNINQTGAINSGSSTQTTNTSSLFNISNPNASSLFKNSTTSSTTPTTNLFNNQSNDESTTTNTTNSATSTNLFANSSNNLFSNQNQDQPKKDDTTLINKISSNTATSNDQSQNPPNTSNEKVEANQSSPVKSAPKIDNPFLSLNPNQNNPFTSQSTADIAAPVSTPTLWGSSNLFQEPKPLTQNNSVPIQLFSNTSSVPTQNLFSNPVANPISPVVSQSIPEPPPNPLLDSQKLNSQSNMPVNLFSNNNNNLFSNTNSQPVLSRNNSAPPTQNNPFKQPSMNLFENAPASTVSNQNYNLFSQPSTNLFKNDNAPVNNPYLAPNQANKSNIFSQNTNNNGGMGGGSSGYGSNQMMGTGMQNNYSSMGNGMNFETSSNYGMQNMNNPPTFSNYGSYNNNNSYNNPPQSNEMDVISSNNNGYNNNNSSYGYNNQNNNLFRTNTNTNNIMDYQNQTNHNNNYSNNGYGNYGSGGSMGGGNYNPSNNQSQNIFIRSEVSDFLQNAPSAVNAFSTQTSNQNQKPNNSQPQMQNNLLGAPIPPKTNTQSSTSSSGNIQNRKILKLCQNQPSQRIN